MKKGILLVTTLLLLALSLPCAAQVSPAPVKQALLNAYENDAFYTSMDFAIIEDLYRYDIYESLNDAVLAITTGKCDYGNLPAISVDYILARGEALEASESSGEMYYFMATTPDNAELQTELTNGIAKLKENGTLDALIEKYLADVGIEPENEGETNAIEGAKTIRIGVTGDVPPMDYIDAKGVPAGFNVALLAAMSEELGVNFEMVSITAGARLVALTTGKIDALFYAIGHGENASDYNDSRVLLTESYYSCGMKRVCRVGELSAINEAMINVAETYAQRTAK